MSIKNYAAAAAHRFLVKQISEEFGCPFFNLGSQLWSLQHVNRCDRRPGLRVIMRICKHI